MAVAFDAVTTMSMVDPYQLTHTASGTDRLAVIIVAGVRNNAVAWTFDGVTYDGNNCTFRAGAGQQVATGRYLRVEVWTYADPPTGAKTVGATDSAATLSESMVCITFTGVNAVGDAQAALGTGTSPTVNLTTSQNSAVIAGGVGGHEQAGALAPGTGITERWDFDNQGSNNNDDHRAAGGHKDAATAGSHTFDYSLNNSEDWCIVAVEIQPAGAAGTTAPGARLLLPLPWLQSPKQEGAQILCLKQLMHWLRAPTRTFISSSRGSRRPRPWPLGSWPLTTPWAANRPWLATPGPMVWPRPISSTPSTPSRPTSPPSSAVATILTCTSSTLG